MTRFVANTSDCTQCALHGRRDFLRDVATVAMAGALPIRLLSALARGADGPRYPLPTADGVQIDRDQQVILVRWQNAVYAFNLSCPHQNTALRWDAPDTRFQCPKHHSKYQPDGTFIEGRATRNMDRFTVRRDAEMVVVDVDAMHKSDEDKSAWTSAVVQL